MRHRGVEGRAVLRLRLLHQGESARGAGRAGMWLGVNQENERANAFYDKSGFARVGAKKFLVGENWEDDFVRERVL